MVGEQKANKQTKNQLKTMTITILHHSKPGIPCPECFNMQNMNTHGPESLIFFFLAINQTSKLRITYK